MGGPEAAATSSTQRAIDNAVTAVLALGGSTNAIVHLIAIARRAGVALDLDRFDALARRTPVLANIRPSGKYLMEDFFYAGGLRALLARAHRPARHLGAARSTAARSARTSPARSVYNDDVIRPRDESARSRATASRCCAATWRPTAR